MSDIDSLREAILSLDGPVFAVLDGAQFEKLPETLLRSGLEARCLYLDRGDNHPERLLTAPFMVGPLDDDALEKVLALLTQAGLAAAVFWECNEGADVLYRHLRGINMVRIPLPSATARGEGTGPTTDFETVLFRHADANGMAQIAPALGPGNAGRLIGPASLIAYTCEREWRIFPPDQSVRLDLPVLLRETGLRGCRGLLELSQEEYDRVAAIRMERSRFRVASYLRDVAAEDVDGLDDGRLYDVVVGCERSGRAMGLRTEAGFARWAYLMVSTDGRFAEGEPVRKGLAGSANPDRTLATAFNEMARLAQRPSAWAGHAGAD